MTTEPPDLLPPLLAEPEAAPLPQKRRSDRWGTTNYLAVAALQRASGFLLLPFLVRSLTPAQYGRISLLLTIWSLATLLMTAGLELPLYRSVFATDEDGRLTRRACLQMLQVVGPVLGVLSVAGSSIVPGAFAKDIGWYVLAAGLYVAGTTGPLVLIRATENYARYSFFSISITVLQSATRVTFVIGMGLGVRGWVLADLVSGAAIVALGLGMEGRQLLGSFPRTQAREALRLGLPVIPHLTGHWVLNLSDSVVILVLTSSHELGIYSSAYQLALVVTVLATEINRTFMPRYAEQSQVPVEERTVVRPAKKQLMTVLVLTLPVLLFGWLAARIILPHSYHRSADLVAPVVAGAMFLGLYYIPTNVQTLTFGISKGIWKNTLTASIVNLGINFALIPHFGIGAAAVSSGLGYLVLLMVTFVRAERVTGHVVTQVRSLVIGGAAVTIVVAVCAQLLQISF